MIQQAILQVLTPIFDPHFSNSSYGYRPERCGQDAVKAALGHAEAGHRFVVDLDLEKFFDRVNHVGDNREGAKNNRGGSL